MEQTQHSESAFVTLTYADDYLPTGYHPETDQWIPTLVKSHCQSWIRSVRQRLIPHGITMRYFLSGEYGTRSGRPHYHAILFGIGPTWENLFEKSWRKGFISSYPATASSMAYTAKYCLKGSGDPELLLPTCTPHMDPKESRVTEPPFRLTSRKPAIGATFAPNIATSLNRLTGRMNNYDPEQVPSSGRVRIEGTKYPLDRTIKKHIEVELQKNGVHQKFIDAMLHFDHGDPSDESITKGRQAHIKALQSRNTRNKL